MQILSHAKMNTGISLGFRVRRGYYNDWNRPHVSQRIRDRRKFCVIDVPRQYENLRLSQE